MLQNHKYGCHSPQRLNAVVAVFMEIGILWNCCRGFKECGHMALPPELSSGIYLITFLAF